VKVGVIIPAYNVLPFIETCLTTVHAQTYAYPCSAYVVDDCSTDGTFEFLADRPSWYRRLGRNETRQGWPKTLNAAGALALADGCDAVFTANADDFLRLDCIEQCVRLLREGRDWAVTNAQQVGGENVVQACVEGATLADFAVWPPLTNYALIPSRIWQEVGGYSSDVTVPGSYGAAEDWDFWIKVLKAGYTDYGVVAEATYYYRMHPGQLHEGRAGIHEAGKRLLYAKHPDLAKLANERQTP
jgi:GT2 family glycosyltransferase